MLLGDHDVALASIEKVVAGKKAPGQIFIHIFFCVGYVYVSGAFSVSVGPSRTKLVTPNSSLKFTPEELVLYCRDLRVLCFLFDRLTPDAQAVEVCAHCSQHMLLLAVYGVWRVDISVFKLFTVG